jgi:hypothetical protein
VYDVDADGMPTDPEVVETLRNATLEQVSWRLDNGEDEGLPIPYGSVAIGSVRLSGPRGGGAGGGGSSGPRLGEQAEQILRAAGLLNHGPRQD